MNAFFRSRTINAIQCTSLATALLLASGIWAETEKSSEPAQPKPLKVKVTGATLSFVPMDITPRRRNARSEASLLKKATARLSTSRILTYRRKELPRRDYRLAIERRDAERWSLLFWPEETKGTKKASGQTEKKKKNKNKKNKAGDKRRSEPKPAFRVPLSLASVPSEDHRVVFELKPLEKGKRVQIVVRAGSTQLRGALRWKTD